jgi:hypothetical protein
MVKQLEELNHYDTLYQLMEKVTFIKKLENGSTNRKNFPSYRGALFGLSRPRFKYKGGLQISRDSKKNPEIYKELKRIGDLVCPIPWNSIQVNKNLVCPKHVDKKNVGDSLLVSFGNYSGCNLVVNDIEYNTKHRPIIFNGSNFEHYNTDDLVGTKYSIVFFMTAGVILQEEP